MAASQVFVIFKFVRRGVLFIQGFLRITVSNIGMKSNKAQGPLNRTNEELMCHILTRSRVGQRQTLSLEGTKCMVLYASSRLIMDCMHKNSCRKSLRETLLMHESYRNSLQLGHSVHEKRFHHRHISFQTIHFVNFCSKLHSTKLLTVSIMAQI